MSLPTLVSLSLLSLLSLGLLGCGSNGLPPTTPPLERDVAFTVLGTFYAWPEGDFAERHFTDAASFVTWWGATFPSMILGTAVDQPGNPLVDFATHHVITLPGNGSGFAPAAADIQVRTVDGLAQVDWENRLPGNGCPVPMLLGWPVSVVVVEPLGDPITFNATDRVVDCL